MPVISNCHDLQQLPVSYFNFGALPIPLLCCPSCSTPITFTRFQSAINQTVYCQPPAFIPCLIAMLVTLQILLPLTCLDVCLAFCLLPVTDQCLLLEKDSAHWISLCLDCFVSLFWSVVCSLHSLAALDTLYWTVFGLCLCLLMSICCHWHLTEKDWLLTCWRAKRKHVNRWVNTKRKLVNSQI